MFEWIIEMVEKGGYLGIVFAMFMENIFPPIPSELVMIFAGASAGNGDLNIFLVILFAAIGSSIGLIPWYYIGKWYGINRLKKFADKYGRFLTFSGKDVDTADRWFDNHGKKMVFFGRALPAVRTFVAIPAAIMGMNIWTFLLCAFLGSILWDGIFGFLGFYLGENMEQIEHYVDIATYITVGVALIWYIYRVITFKK